MLSKEQIDKILEHVSTVPEILIKCEEALDDEGIDAALKILDADKTFRAYFFAVVKKADLEVDMSVQDMSVIANLMGAELFRVLVRSYGIFLKSPKKWKIFNINAVALAELFARLISDWLKLLKHIRKKNIRNLMLVPNMLLNFIVCELVFANFTHEFDEIIKKTDLSYDKILKNLYGIGLFESACKAAGWDLARVSVIDRRIVGYLQLLLVHEFGGGKFSEFNFSKVLNLEPVASFEMTLDFKRLFV